VASTAGVVISGNATFNGTAFKKVVGERVLGAEFLSTSLSAGLFVASGITYAYGLEIYGGKILIPPQATLTNDPFGGIPDKLNTPSNTWRLVAAVYNTPNYNINSIVNNPSTDPNYIPTTGWSPSITITEAPSGIVAATAGNLVIAFDNLGYPRTYVKSSNTFWYYGEGDFLWYLQWNLDNDSKWALRNDFYGADPVAAAKSPVATAAIIPTTGWVYTEGSGPVITIAAA
jgi:hypothetical protein